jgi:tripartite-type tricarboxylate transporter receptor subunit TctC
LTKANTLARLGFFAAALCATSAFGAPWPEKPIRMVVPWPAGGPSDNLARIVTGKVGELLGQTIIVDNRVGASGIIGAEYVAKAAPDGYTLLWVISNHTTNHLLFKVSYDPIRDFAPVSMVARTSYMLVGSAAFQPATLKEFVEYVKARPGKVSYASAGNGTLQHLGMEMFKGTAGLDMVHIPYKGSAPAIADLLGGQVPVTFEATSAIASALRSGRVRALAVASLKRLALFPDVPTIAESGYPGFEIVGFTGAVAPAGTPADVVAKLNAEINAAIALPETREKMVTLGVEPAGSTAAEFRSYIQAQIPRYAKILKASGATVD